MTSRCSTCGINYPYSPWTPCRVCKSKLDPISNATADDDWKEKVELMLADDDAPVKEDPVTAWRFAEAVRCGLSLEEADFVSVNRYIDLARLRTIAQDATPELAFRILA